jgi:hypothetical protein
MRPIAISVLLCLTAVFLVPFVVPEALAQDGGEVVEAAAEVVATPAPPVDSDPIAIGKDILQAAKGGQWRLLVAGILSLLMTLSWKLKIRTWSIFKGDRGGAILLMILALAGSFSTALATEAPVSLELVLGAVSVAFTSVGAWQWGKRLLWPKDDE